MGVISRISDIVNANVNAVLDRAEDPEKMVRLIIAEMEDTLIEIKSSSAEVVADRVRIERELSHSQRQFEQWNRKAELALSKGHEDLAKEALAQGLSCRERSDALQQRLTELQAIASQYLDDIGRLEDKLRLAQQRQRLMVAKHVSLLNRKKVEERIYKVNTTGALARFERYEGRMDRLHAETEILAQSNQTLDQKFRSLEHEGELQREFEALQEKVAATAKS